MGLMVAVPDEVRGAFNTVSSLAADRPLVVAGAVVVLAVLLAVSAVALRRYRRPTGRRFVNVLEDLGAVTVLMHPNPDPDAMSCALAVKQLAESGDTDATLQYPGQIRHQENRAFETVLDADFEQVDNAGDLNDGAVVLVDHNEPRGFSGAEGVDPAAVVDHHPGGGEGREFTDVRTDNGACASIFAEYFREMGWELGDPGENGEATGEQTLPSATATGLLYGIQSDTSQLIKGCSPSEFDGARYLYPGVDEDRLDRIANPEVDAEVLDTKATAITGREVRSAFAVSDVGSVSNVDAVPQAADELLRLEGVTAVVVLGDTDGPIHLSGRSRDDRVHMGKTLSAVVEDVPLGGAGGHARMGGGQLSIEHMNGLGPGDGLTREEFHERLFAAMSGEL